MPASEGLVTSNLDGEVIMMSIDKGKYYGLDAIASQIWELLETPCSIRALCDQLLPQYDVEREQGRTGCAGLLPTGPGTESDSGFSLKHERYLWTDSF